MVSTIALLLLMAQVPVVRATLEWDVDRSILRHFLMVFEKVWYADQQKYVYRPVKLLGPSSNVCAGCGAGDTILYGWATQAEIAVGPGLHTYVVTVWPGGMSDEVVINGSRPQSPREVRVLP